MKYEYIKYKLEKFALIDENHGVLSIDKIFSTIQEVFKEYEVSYCYLFGSYAKGKATETSDVDLLIETTVSGLEYFGLIEKLREALNKKVDLLTSRQLENNHNLLNEIFKYGIKIYG